jgi:RimJ/RimL family protein N-acetyltransferase
MQTRGHTLSNGKVLIVREATPDDASSIITFLEAMSAESDNLTFGPGEFGYSEAHERAFIRDCEAADNRLFLVAFIDDAFIGMVTFTGGDRPRLRHSGEIGLVVSKAHWDKGIGSILLDSVVQWAQGGGAVTKLNLRVRTDHARAVALYESKGFRIEGTITRALRIRGGYFDHYWMGMEI